MARARHSAGAADVAPVLFFIERNLGERLTLPRLAGELEVSSFHLAHVFKRATGMAPHQYVMQRRLDRARQLLQETDLPISQIALAVGCSNQSHFSALFHRALGVTPLAYRRRT